jgi:hypothetical protein
MDLPSFIWLWRIAAWSMGFSLLAFVLLALSGGAMFYFRRQGAGRPTGLEGAGLEGESAVLEGAFPFTKGVNARPAWLRPAHYALGALLVLLVLLLLSIGIIGTLGEFGKLGHSVHLPAGLTVVTLTLASAWCATRISPERPWARTAHLALNGVLFFALVAVTATGWSVVQKYL